jgi:protocatechuate 3,4-dioxygenase beta subunit
MSTMHRRELLRRLALGIAAIPLVQACGGDDGESLADASNPVDGPTGWASGGTAAMTDKASYPDPFATAATSCVLVVSTTEGPCTTATDLEREDISEGLTGLPVRLALRVIDSSCTPIAGAVVKIWHTNAEGSYSGVTPNPNMCLATQSYASMNFMRGVQTTDANGVVYFDTCFPGWYSGRAIHIHFQVMIGGTSTRVSQLFFPENVTNAIFASHVDYKAYGQPNTTFANDNIIAPITGEDRTRLIFDVAKMSDGAMLASKVVSVA